MTCAPGKHPNSQANLVQWKPGQSGNPAGRIPGRVYVTEHVSSLLGYERDGSPKYSKADLEKIVADDNADVAKSIAAAWLLTSMKTGECWVIGKDGELQPARIDAEPGRERERLMDRFEGKPAVTVTHIQEPLPEISDLQDQLGAMIEAYPALREFLPQAGPAQAGAVAHALGGKLKGDHQMIDADWTEPLQEFKSDETSE